MKQRWSTSSKALSKKKAFTLIELLVVIAIIAILAAILFPVFAQAKKAAKVTVTVSNAKQLAIGINLYSADTDDVMPMTIQSLDIDDTPGGTWWTPNEMVGILQMMYPYVKNNDIWWNGLNPKPGSLATPMTPIAPSGTWGDWTKEQTILPNNIALNVWDGAAQNIKPRSVTSVDEPAALGVFFPVAGPLQGVATWSSSYADVQIDIDPWYNACVPSYTDPSVNDGYPPVYAAHVTHNNSSPVAFADGHAGKIKNNAFYQNSNCHVGSVPGYDGANGFIYQHYPNRLWGWYLQGYQPVN
ncbi:MAG: prepilin-type N-terminal cleavage/methylation domain-containing protein [Armatimonadetes bacterium]|nr:prepilin-type N-terminal cleavage/methylation domain-containing protein [Armatimonadota bacterium]MBS1726493.1 prepilin-type N-terminal cleavage/methylation domain-containing protein [Armatimonadota bacterium]